MIGLILSMGVGAAGIYLGHQLAHNNFSNQLNNSALPPAPIVPVSSAPPSSTAPTSEVKK